MCEVFFGTHCIMKLVTERIISNTRKSNQLRIYLIYQHRILIYSGPPFHAVLPNSRSENLIVALLLCTHVPS